MKRVYGLSIFFIVVLSFFVTDLTAQEAKWRMEMLNLIRNEKFDTILPKVMRENNIDMWIHTFSGSSRDALTIDLGINSGYAIFTDQGGERIERAVLGGGGTLQRESGIYDIFESPRNLRAFVAERDPQRISINLSENLEVSDGITHSAYMALVEAVGPKYTERFVSADRLIADFRSLRVQSEIVLYARLCEISRNIMETALSNRVTTKGKTTLKDVAWWIKEEHRRRGFGETSRLPQVFLRYPDGNEISSNDHIIEGGDFIAIDFGINDLNFGLDLKRIAYVLKDGEFEVPDHYQQAFDQSLAVRDILRKNIRPGRTGAETLELLFQKVEEAGYNRMEIEDIYTTTNMTDVNIGSHSVGNRGHGAGPAFWERLPWHMEMELRPTNLIALEYNIYMPVPGWPAGHKIYIPMEENVIITENGFEFLYPDQNKILLIR